MNQGFSKAAEVRAQMPRLAAPRQLSSVPRGSLQVRPLSNEQLKAVAGGQTSVYAI